MSKTMIMEKQTLSPQLFIIQAGEMFTVDVLGKLVFGRNAGQNKVDVGLRDCFVSRVHGELSKDSGGYYYVDKNSTNGTYHNGRKLFSETKQYLQDGDVLHIYSGNYSVDKAFVAIIFSTDYPKSWKKEEISLGGDVAEVNIGRAGSQSVLMANNMVSENHASFFAASSGWAVVDHNSTNGVFLNNQRLCNAKYLKVGDCIRIVNDILYEMSTEYTLKEGLEKIKNLIK